MNMIIPSILNDDFYIKKCTKQPFWGLIRKKDNQLMAINMGYAGLKQIVTHGRNGYDYYLVIESKLDHQPGGQIWLKYFN